MNCELLPDLILLDINLPKIDGKEVLIFIKNDTILKKIPVVMLTTSSSEMDINDAYNNHANCFIIKPVDFNKFISVIKMIENFKQIKKLVEKEFKVTVTDVRNVNLPGKTRKFKGVNGKTSPIRKAIVQLKKGDRIAAFDVEDTKQEVAASK